MIRRHVLMRASNAGAGLHGDIDVERLYLFGPTAQIMTFTITACMLIDLTLPRSRGDRRIGLADSGGL
jgi:hypothetical protein